jgi:uncharacterized protein (TIGR03435 family)
MSPDEVKKTMEQRLKATMQAEAASGDLSSARVLWRSYEMRDASAADIARRISQFLQKPVADMTDLAGKYTFRLEIRYARDDSPEYAASQALANFGLKLNSRKVSTRMIVVDSALTTPTEN